MTVARETFGPLERLLLAHSFGAALGVVATVFIFDALGLSTGIALFLVPMALGFHLIDRAFHAGAQQRDDTPA